MIRVAVIEDLESYRKVLQTLLNGYMGFTCSAAYKNAEEAIAEIHLIMPDVAMVDIHLPGTNGIELVKFIRINCPGTLLLCTAYDEDDLVFSSLKAGAHAYILKSTSPGKLLEAVRELTLGGSPMSNEIARKVVMTFNNEPLRKDQFDLTPREKEVLKLLSRGLLSIKK